MLILKKVSRRQKSTENFPGDKELTLKAPITTAADDKFCDIFPYLKKEGMIFHENRLPADDFHEIACLICYY